tara:strand:- start:617 stop:982 length:366 start_codon:yes stop_codon:yes gene_type:complete
MTNLYFPRLIEQDYKTPPKILNSWRNLTRNLLLLKYKNIDNIINNLENNIDYRTPAYKYKILTEELYPKIEERDRKMQYNFKIMLGLILQRLDLPLDLTHWISSYCLHSTKIYNYMKLKND